MIMLALDSASRAASCALLRDGAPVAASCLDVGLTHSQTLLPMLDAMLRGAGCGMADIDALAVTVGPGSFTGVRIGVATAKGLAFPREIPCIPVSTLQALAHSVPPYADATLCAALDARRGQVYAAIFRAEGGAVRRLSEDEACGAAELARRLAELSTPLLLVGDGAALLVKEGVEGCVLPALHTATGAALAAHALQLPAVHPDALRPVYLRLPQAERERLEREGRV